MYTMRQSGLCGFSNTRLLRRTFHPQPSWRSAHQLSTSFTVKLAKLPDFPHFPLNVLSFFAVRSAHQLTHETTLKRKILRPFKQFFSQPSAIQAFQSGASKRPAIQMICSRFFSPRHHVTWLSSRAFVSPGERVLLRP
jgi:hypothetical protein